MGSRPPFFPRAPPRSASSTSFPSRNRKRRKRTLHPRFCASTSSPSRKHKPRKRPTRDEFANAVGPHTHQVKRFEPEGLALSAQAGGLRKVADPGLSL